MDGTVGPDRVREFVDLIVDSLDDTADGSEIARRGYLSRYHFDRLVAAALQETPGAFRRRLLLERAAWQLAGRRAPSITSVALDAGYLSVEGFTRAFGRAFGMPPGRYRSSRDGFRVAAPNGIHFHPPGGLLVPGIHERRSNMDVVDRLIGHDIWFTSRLLDKASGLPETALDKAVLAGAPLLFGEPPITLREILASMVGNKEMWTAAVEGRAIPENSGSSVESLKERLDRSGAAFAKLVKTVSDKDDWNSGFVDATCDPPQSFTYGGMLAHVITFSTYRRNLAILAFRELGVDDLGLGDPIEWERRQR